MRAQENAIQLYNYMDPNSNPKFKEYMDPNSNGECISESSSLF